MAKRSKNGENSYPEVTKTFALRVVEFARSLQLVRDAIEHVHEGRIYHVIGLSGQLRALLLDDARHVGPLFFEICAAFDFPLEVYAIAPSSLPRLSSGPVFEYVNAPLTLEKVYNQQRLTPFSEIIQRTLITYEGQKFSYKKVIEVLANRAGGAHYSRNLPKAFMDLLAVSFGALNPMQVGMLSIGEVVQQLGSKLLQKQFGSETLLHFYLPRFPHVSFRLLRSIPSLTWVIVSISKQMDLYMRSLSV